MSTKSTCAIQAEVPERQPEAADEDPIAPDFAGRSKPARGGDGDAFLARHVPVAGVEVQRVRSVTLHADTAHRLSTLVQRQAARVG